MSERESSEVRRSEIVEAMIAVMAREGYAKATINKIADEASLTGGLLHYHFANKGAILAAVFERLVREQLDELQEANKGTAAERLEALMTKLLAPGKSARPQRVATWVAITAEAIRQPEIGAQMEEALMAFREMLAAIIADGVKEGAFELAEEATAQQVAAALVALVQGYYTMGITARSVVPRGSALPMAKKMIAGLVGQ